jgi:hypothetical protein
MKIRASDLALELMGEVCEKAVKPGDYVSIEGDHYGNGYISYSRYFSGGAYSSVANFSVHNSILVVTPVITGIPEGWKHGEPIKVPMSDPEIIDILAGFVSNIFSENQTDRRPMNSDGAKNWKVRVRPKKSYRR